MDSRINPIAFVIALLACMVLSPSANAARKRVCPGVRDLLGHVVPTVVEDIPAFLGNPVERVHIPVRNGRNWVTPPDASGERTLSRTSKTYVYKFMSHRVLRGDNAEVNHLIDVAESVGGEVWVVSVIDEEGKRVPGHHRLDFFGHGLGKTPVLALEAATDPPTIAHELEHLYYYRNLHRQYLDKGMSPEAANWKTNTDLYQDRHIRQTEIDAVTAEMKVRGTHAFDPEYVERVTYPARTAILRLMELDQQAPSFTAHAGWKQEAIEFADEAVLKAIWVRTLRQNHLKHALASGKIDAKRAQQIRRQLKGGPADAHALVKEMGVHPDGQLGRYLRERAAALSNLTSPAPGPQN